MIKPTIGRRVWYWPSAFDSEISQNQSDPLQIAYGHPGQPCDAGIALVHSDRLINISVADHTGQMHSRTSVALLQDDDEAPASDGYAQWMPYQQDQAAKTQGDVILEVKGTSSRLPYPAFPPADRV